MKKLIKVIVCLSLSTAAYTPVAAAKAVPGPGNKVKGKGKKCEEVKRQLEAQCKANGFAAGSTDATAGQGAQGDVQSAGNAAMASSNAFAGASKDCKESAKECNECEGQNKDDKEGEKKERELCAAAIFAAGGTLDKQSASTGSDGAGLLAAAAMMGAAALPLLMKKDKDEEQKPSEYQGALRPDGTVDCSKGDASQFSACDDKTAESCKTAMADNRCAQFANRYCNEGGGGVGSNYCNTVAAYQFVTTGGGHPGCPTYDNYMKQTNPSCDPAQGGDPAAVANCQMQNSPEETEKMRSSCPNDPVFQGESGGTQIVTAPPAGSGVIPPPNSGLPAPILPAGTGSSGRQAAITPPNGGSGQVAVMSVGGRDANTYGMSSTAPTQGTVIGSKSARDVASTVGPAPDVGGQFAPNLFATSSQVIRNRCAAGRFNNCP